MMNQAYFYLMLAVIFEVFGSTCLQASQQLTRFWPSLGIVVGFGGAFVFFMQVLKVMPLGVTYAMWSGLGITLVTITSYFIFNQKIDIPAFLGMSLIIAGIVVIHTFSKTALH